MASQRGKHVSRSKNRCLLLGDPQLLKENTLPTVEDVLKHYLQLYSTFKVDKNEPHGLATKVINDVLHIWESSSLPTISKQRAKEIFQNYLQKYKNLRKVPIKRHKTNSYISKCALFTKNTKQLFDLAICKCPTFDCCTCIKDRKIPYQEQDFLKYQRTARKMIISQALDKASSLKTRRILDRRAKEEARSLPQQIDFQD